MSIEYSLGLAVTMFDEEETVQFNLGLWGHKLSHIEVVQSQDEPYASIDAIITSHPSAFYTCLPNLDNRTDEQKAKSSERFDFGQKSMARNFSAAFQGMRNADYVICITGDTKIYHLYGIYRIIANMGGAEVACSRPMGQSLHKAEWTREEMADPRCPKGGRLQDESNKDFMPQFFIVKESMIERLSNINVTNPWCFEQCLGDAIGDAEQYVFAKNAYEFNDGIVYNVPSPTNWKHGR